MSCLCTYSPVPTRVWSRVQNRCTYVDSSSNAYYQSVFIPLPAIPFTQQPMPLAEANYQEKLLYKGNILQYKGNSSQLTKKQKYTQLAKGFGPSRTKVFATQTQTYTNPNTTGLYRVNYTTYPFPNTLVGKPNNISGPFQYAVPNPNGCLNPDGTPSTALQDGGSLVCGTLANPCTNDLIKANNGSAAICNPASASDVPGTSFLCWNRRVQTWFPRQRYVMPNSGTKWPEGYKGLVSAVKPKGLILTTQDFLSLNEYYANGYYGAIIQTTLPATTTQEYGIGTFSICIGVNNVSILIVGGGGGGGSGYDNNYGGGGGGGGGINYITEFSPPTNTVITLKVGAGGSVRPGDQDGGNAVGYYGGNSSISYSSISITSYGGGGGLGAGTTTVGGGMGGNGQKTGGIVGTYNGYGGGGGGGGVGPFGGNIEKPGLGGIGSPTPTNDGYAGTQGSTNLAGTGGSEVRYAFNLPFLPPSSQTIYVSGGGGGGGVGNVTQNLGGLAGHGVGGAGQSASGVSGQDATNYGGGGGGGGGSYTDSPPPNNYGGKGGSGLIAIWWPI